MSETDSETAPETGDPRKRRDLKALRALWPFLRPYWAVLIGAFIALCLSSVATLALPSAGRGIIDHGFTKADPNAVAFYFLIGFGVCSASGSWPICAVPSMTICCA
jgi:ATP-binding cassette subfamily B protein